MERNWLNRTRHIAVRVNESAFERLQAVADAEQKPLGEWCRDTLIAVASRRLPSPFEFGLLAEMTATQAIVIHLLCTVGKDGRISTQKAQEIVDAAHDNKYSEAIELFRLAQSKSAKLRSETNGPGERRRKEERHD